MPVILIEVVGDDLEGATLRVLSDVAPRLLIHVLIGQAEFCGGHRVIFSCFRRLALLLPLLEGR